MSGTVVALIGWPVERSLSPPMHNAAFEAVGIPWSYITLAVRPGAIAEGMELYRSLDAAGANVTIPHKETVVPLLDAIEGEAKTFGAVNTIVRDGERLVGHNTDGAGFLRFLRDDAGFDPAGARAHVAGAGGAARAVAVALAGAGAVVTVTARRREQAIAIASMAPGVASGWWEEPPGAELVVNATPVRGELPVRLDGARLVVDLIYRPPTDLLTRARDAGIAAFDGLGMLVHQAALSFELWTGRPAPLDLMRSAAETARLP